MEQLWAFVLAAYIAAGILLWNLLRIQLFDEETKEEWKKEDWITKMIASILWALGWLPAIFFYTIRSRRNQK